MPKPVPTTIAAARSPLEIEYLPTNSINPDPSNARRHSQRQIAALKAGITQFGFANPILIDELDQIIAGHARHQAAVALRLDSVPTIRLRHLSKAQKAALALADNKLSDMSSFDPDALAEQLRQLCAVEFPIELTGFSTAEVDLLIDTPQLSVEDPADRFEAPTTESLPVSQVGDLWRMGPHRLIVGNAQERPTFDRLFGEDRAAMIFTDPPYNVPIQGHVSGLGRVNHREFAMACGEMSPTEFTAFLATSMIHCVEFSNDGSIHFICMDWRHLGEVLAAGKQAYAELKAFCVWDKTNAGMGSLYRSRHELVLVFKNGTCPHINNVNLGRDGRYRTNVWTYAGANAFGKNRDEDLSAHPTVKPTALVADAIRDCSRRGDIILDPFLGSGTTILAAHRTGRRAFGVELDRLYADVAIDRWQRLTGEQAILEGCDLAFAAIREGRASEGASNGGGEIGNV